MELVVFTITAIIALVGAIAMLMSKNAIHSALFLLLNMIAIAVLYLLLRAPFLVVVAVGALAACVARLLGAA